MPEYDNHRFKSSGVAIPPIVVFAAEGTTWTGPRLSVRSAGDEHARLRALGLRGYARAEAQRVVAGVPTGPWLDITTTDDFSIDAALDELETFDFRVVVLPRAGGFVRLMARLGVVSHRGVGI